MKAEDISRNIITLWLDTKSFDGATIAKFIKLKRGYKKALIKEMKGVKKND